MAQRGYGQFCGFARALEVVGERWTMLVVRDLLVGPKRFTDLLRGLPGIPTNVLATRLKELELAGVARRRALPRPSGSIVYELTPYGLELDDVVVRLGRWGAKALGDPRPGEIVTADSIVSAMRSTFRSEAARGVRATYELHFGPVVVHVGIDDGKLEVADGPLPGADLVIESGPALKALMAAEITPQEAIASGAVRIEGKTALLARFADIFRIDPMPVD